MARRYVQRGDVLDWTNGTGSDVASGDIVILGDDSVGIANVDIADGEKGAVAVEGVYRVPKATGTAWELGAAVGYDGTGFDIGVSGAGTVETCAVAAADAEAGDDVGLVKIANPGAAGTV